MKNYILILFVLTCFTSFSQRGGGNATVNVRSTTECCPYYIEVTLNKSQINSLHNTPITAIVPPSGFGVRLVRPVTMNTYFDGTFFVFASGEYINLYNGANVLPLMTQFSDPCVTDQGIFSGSYWHTYELVRSGQVINSQTQNGAVQIKSTFPITGGGTNCSIVFRIYYELVQY